MEGIKTRSKLRIRSYSDAPDAPLFLEIKRRLNGVIRKQRCQIRREELPGLIAAMSGMEAGDRKLAMDAFHSLALRIGAQPMALVRYQRQAYEGAFDPSIRITFDRHLATRLTRQPEVRLEDPEFCLVADVGVVLEIKFNQRYPSWLLSAVQKHSLRRRSFSKYCESIDAARRVGQVR